MHHFARRCASHHPIRRVALALAAADAIQLHVGERHGYNEACTIDRRQVGPEPHFLDALDP